MATTTAATSPPLFECTLQGAVNDDNFGHLLERLRGLCSTEVPLNYREICYKTLPGMYTCGCLVFVRVVITSVISMHVRVCMYLRLRCVCLRCVYLRVSVVYVWCV